MKANSPLLYLVCLVVLLGDCANSLKSESIRESTQESTQELARKPTQKLAQRQDKTTRLRARVNRPKAELVAYKTQRQCTRVDLDERILSLEKVKGGELEKLLATLAVYSGCMREDQREFVADFFWKMTMDTTQEDLAIKVLTHVRGFCDILGSDDTLRWDNLLMKSNFNMGLPTFDLKNPSSVRRGRHQCQRLCLACPNVKSFWKDTVCKLSTNIKISDAAAVINNYYDFEADNGRTAKLIQTIERLPSMGRTQLNDALAYISSRRHLLLPRIKKMVVENLRKMITEEKHTNTIANGLGAYKLCRILGQGDPDFDLGLPFVKGDGIFKRVWNWGKIRARSRDARALSAYETICDACRDVVDSPWIDNICWGAEMMSGIGESKDTARSTTGKRAPDEPGEETSNEEESVEDLG